MKSKKELIETAKSLDTDKSYSSLYEFAAKYLMSRKQQSNTTAFFRTVRELMNNPANKQNAAVMGFSGNHFNITIKKWCEHILSRKELQGLEYCELHYVMGYCARLAKMKDKGIPIC